MAQFLGKAQSVTQVSTGQVTGQQAAGPALESLPAGAQVRGQVAGGAPEGMMRLAVGSARLDVKADVPLPAGTPVLIEVEQAAPEMRLKVSADASALQGRSVPSSGTSPAAGTAVPGSSLPESSLQGLQLKASIHAEGPAGSPAGALSTGAGAAINSRPAQTSVDLSTFVFLQTEAAAPKTGKAPAAVGRASQPAGTAGGQAAGAAASAAVSQAVDEVAVRPTAGLTASQVSQPVPQPLPQAGAPEGMPQTLPSAPSQTLAMGGGGVSAPPSQTPGTAANPAGAFASAPAPQASSGGAGQTAVPPLAGTSGAVPVPSGASSPSSGGAPSAAMPGLPGTPSTVAGLAAAGIAASSLSVPGSIGAGIVSPVIGAGPAVSGIAADPAAGQVLTGSQASPSAGSPVLSAAPAGAQPQPSGPGSPAAAGATMAAASKPVIAQAAAGALEGSPPATGQAGSAGGSGGQTAASASAASASASAVAKLAGVSAGPSGAMANLPPLSGPEAEAELQALARGAGPLTARGDAALALDAQALKPVLAEPAQARTVLASLMGTVSKLDVTSLPPAGQKLVEALKGMQADAETLADPARLKAAVEAVLGLAAGAGGAVAAGLARKANVPQKADGLTSLLVRLAGLADEVLLVQPSSAGGQKTGQTAAKPQVMQNLDPDAALALAQKTGSEVGGRVQLHSASRMAAEYLIRDMAQAAGRGTAQETQSSSSRSVSGGSAAVTQQSGSSSSAARPVDISLDLPVLIDGQSRVMSLRISRDPQQAEMANDAKGPEWRVRFSMDLPDGGPVEAAAGLRGTSSYVTLRAAEDDTLAGFLSRRETLAALFADEGLELEDLRILKAKPETSAAVPPAPLDRSS